MGATEVLRELDIAGIELSLEPDREHIRAQPTVALTDELRAFIRTHKPVLVEELKRQLVSPACDICENVRYRTSLDGTRGWPECSRSARALAVVPFGEPVTCQLFAPAAGLFDIARAEGDTNAP